MIKAVSAIAATAAVCVIVVGLLVWNRSSETPPAPVARLIPAETLLLAELPDCRLSGTRWRQTALRGSLNEAEVAAFLERPRSRLPQMAVFNKLLDGILAADPRQAFFAVTAVTDNMPHAVGGFSFRQSGRPAVEAVIVQARNQARTNSPAGKSDLLKFRSSEIETFSDNGVVVAGAFADDWYLFANDVELLKSTLDRFSRGKPDGSLSLNPAFRKSTAHLPAKADFRFFVQTSGFIEKFLALLNLSGRSIDPDQSADLKKIEAMAGATCMEDQRMRDTFFVLKPGGIRSPVLNHSTLSLTSPDTLVYYAFTPLIPSTIPLPPVASPLPLSDRSKAADPLTTMLEEFRGVLNSLGEQGVRVADFKAAFGPEFAAFANWPAPKADSLGIEDVVQPTFQIAGQVRDAALAIHFTETVCAPWKREDVSGLHLWHWPAGEPGTSPVLGLTEHFLFAGMSSDALKSNVAKLKAKGGTLETSAAFTGALATVAPAGNSLVYVDAKPLFERLYEWVRPIAMIWANFVPHAGDFVQMAKLPATDTVARHLLPMVLSSSQTDDGILLESSGPVTFFQTAAALAGITSAAAVPVIEGKITVPGLDSLLNTMLFGGSAPAEPKH